MLMRFVCAKYGVVLFLLCTFVFVCGGVSSCNTIQDTECAILFAIDCGCVNDGGRGNLPQPSFNNDGRSQPGTFIRRQARNAVDRGEAGNYCARMHVCLHLHASEDCITECALVTVVCGCGVTLTRMWNTSMRSAATVIAAALFVQYTRRYEDIVRVRLLRSARLKTPMRLCVLRICVCL